jgi:thymidylate synthase ThyX
MYKASILADSTHNGNRLVTFELEMPRYIWPEFLTHREFSRNAQSSRAIPNYKMIENLRGDSKVEPTFMLNQPGMTAEYNISPALGIEASKIWDEAMEYAIKASQRLAGLGIHKQVTNRLLEPFSTIKAIVSSTSYENFFNLRCSSDAQQEIQTIAYMMREAMAKSTSRRVDVSYYHLPLVTLSERDMYAIEILKKLCVARCARVSYLNHKGDTNISSDLTLYNKLLSSKHASAFEHCATPMPERHGNFNGWQQHRQEVSL